MNIIKKTGTHCTTAARNRKIEYIAIHYTAGVTSKKGAAINTAAWFLNSQAGGSADFIVDDVEFVQYNPDPKNRYCWAVGGNVSGTKGGKLRGKVTNYNSISIEICSSNNTAKMTAPNDSHYSFTPAVLKNAIELTKYLMKEYGIDADHVVRHYDVSGKLCPGIVGWNADSGNEIAWNNFKAQLVEPAAVNPNEAKVKERFGFNDATIAYLKAYKFGDALLEKLATAK